MKPRYVNARNPSWTRDELILTLNAYFENVPGAPDPKSPEVIELSNLLRSMRDSGARPSYRSPASVVMKLMNFRSLDPSYGGKGLEAVGRADREIWAAFAADKAMLKAVADGIRRALVAGYRLEDSTEESETVEALEGRLLARIHQLRERSPKLVTRKKADRLREAGRLQCEVCGFDFAAVYGSRGEGFIEYHHMTPLHLLDETHTTKLEDLILLCANCHRMVHSRRPWLSVDDLRALLTPVATSPALTPKCP